MKETDERKSLNKKDKNHYAKADHRDHKPHDKNRVKNLGRKDNGTKASPVTAKTAAKSSQVYENDVVAAVDVVDSSEETLQSSETLKMEEKGSSEKQSDNSSNCEDESREGTVDESDAETINDSVSSHGDSFTAEEEKAEKVSSVHTIHAKNVTSDEYSSPLRSESSSITTSKGTPNTKLDTEPFRPVGKDTQDNSKNMKVHPKPLVASLKGADGKPLEKEKDKLSVDQKIEEMEDRVKQLEGELREVAALEVALYSVSPEHGSSAHKVHTPARRLSRLYIFACKYWSQDKRATVARNTVSGLVLVSKSCGNDVSRLTFWLSNVVVLREILSQTFGSSCQASALERVFGSNGGGNMSEPKFSSLKRKNSTAGTRHLNNESFLQFVDDWQESRTLTAALEKVESWIFYRIVESIWWQTLTPHMQPPRVDDSTMSGSAERFLGPALGDQQQGNFSVNLWKNAFQDSLKRLCPIREGGHECGCLPVLSRNVMEQCVARLDVAMFNAILRESAHEIPTDPISDPIVDSKVLPIPAGDLSFGSGAQLKNSVGHWARWMTDFLGTDSDSFEDNRKTSFGTDEPKYFPLLNALSDLLMLPKDMLMDRTIRKEVCPLITLPLVKRVLCNFTPDEFCPDPVPGSVLEELNADCMMERKSGGSVGGFPYTAAPVVYVPPCNVVGVGENSQLSRSSSLQRKGYTSDEELDQLDTCPTSVIDKLLSSSEKNGQENNVQGAGNAVANARYALLREVWLSMDP